MMGKCVFLKVNFMRAETITGRNSFVFWILRLILFAVGFFISFCAGLIALSFLDDLVQYQPHMTEKTNLLIGVGFATLCGIGGMFVLSRFFPFRR